MLNDSSFLTWLFPVAFCIGTIAIILLRHLSSNSQPVRPTPETRASFDSTRWEHPFSDRPENWGYLRLQIQTIFENQQPLEVSPWHAEGGDWTFLECMAEGGSRAILIGIRCRRETHSGVSSAWGESMLAIADLDAAENFLSAFSTAFHHQLPKREEGRPRGFLKMSTAVFGTELRRLPGGSFQGKGNWTATKWFLQEYGGDAEVFFNFNVSEKWAEFSEKDPGDYRDDLISEIATALRGGPPPDHAIENDPAARLP